MRLCIWILRGSTKENNGLERKINAFEGRDEGRKLKRGQEEGAERKKGEQEESAG